jgi:hypothetical protein
MTEAELKILMESEGFDEVGEDISKTTKLLNELNGAINGLKRVGDAAGYIDKLGSSIGELNKNLYIDKYIQFNETLYKAGLTAGRSASNIKEYSEAMANLAKNVNTSTENMMKMFSQMQLTANFAKMNNGQMAGFYSKAQSAGLTNEETAKIIGQMNSYAAGPEQMAALAGGDQSAIQDMAQKMMAAGDYEAAQSLLKMTDATNGGGMADRRPGKAKQGFESAKENKELSIGAASREFATNAYKFATFLENFLNKYSYLVAGGKQAGGAGDFMFGAREAIKNAFGFGGAGGSGSGGDGGGSGSGSGGLFGKGLLGKIVSAATFGYFSYTSKKSGDATLVPGAPGTSSASLDPNAAAGNPMAIREANKKEADRQLTWQKLYNDRITTTATIMKAQGASERELQTQRAKAIPVLMAEREILQQKLALEVISPTGSADKVDEYTVAINSKTAAINEETRALNAYKLSVEQLYTLEVNQARLAHIQSTSRDVGETLRLKQQMIDVDKAIAAGIDIQLEKDIKAQRALGATQETIQNMRIAAKKEKEEHLAAAAAREVERAATYEFTGGMKTREFEKQKEALEAVSQIQTTLPTALGDLLETRKGLYGMALAERDTAAEGYRKALAEGKKGEELQKIRLDFLNKSNVAAQKFMDMTGSLTDQIQMAIGELHDVSGGFEETMPKLAEQGLIVRQTMEAAYAPMFKYGGYGSEGAVGQDIFTKTFSTMTNKTSLGLGAAGEAAMSATNLPPDEYFNKMADAVAKGNNNSNSVMLRR